MVIVHKSDVTTRGHLLKTVPTQELDAGGGVLTPPFHFLVLFFFPSFDGLRLYLSYLKRGARLITGSLLVVEESKPSDEHSHLPAKLLGRHRLNHGDGFSRQLVQILIEVLASLFAPSSLGNH